MFWAAVRLNFTGRYATVNSHFVACRFSAVAVVCMVIEFVSSSVATTDCVPVAMRPFHFLLFAQTTASCERRGRFDGLCSCRKCDKLRKCSSFSAVLEDKTGAN